MNKKNITNFESHLKGKLKNKQFKKYFDEYGKQLEIAYLIAQKRKQAKISQKELAQKIGVAETEMNAKMNAFECASAINNHYAESLSEIKKKLQCTKKNESAESMEHYSPVISQDFEVVHGENTKIEVNGGNHYG